MVARGVVALVACCALAIAWCSAQSLQRLTVTQLTLSADTLAPVMETPFHIIIRAHVTQRVMQLENIDLPILANLELLGDEHETVAGSNGTDYREIITVVAHQTGPVTIAPITLDAVDARTGRPERYSSNALTLTVGGVPASVRSVGRDLVRFVTIVAIIASLAVVVALILLWRPRRSRAVSLPAEPLPPPAPVIAPPDPREALERELDRLRRDATRASVLHARATLRSRVGASATETLSDVLARPQSRDVRMRSALVALERAAFTTETDLHAAIAECIEALERMLA